MILVVSLPAQVLKRSSIPRIEKNIHNAVAQLPPEQADVLKRIYIEGKSHSEVSAATGLPLGTVKSRVRLAVGKLRTLL